MAGTLCAIKKMWWGLKLSRSRLLQVRALRSLPDMQTGRKTHELNVINYPPNDVLVTGRFRHCYAAPFRPGTPVPPGPLQHGQVALVSSEKTGSSVPGTFVLPCPLEDA